MRRSNDSPPPRPADGETSRGAHVCVCRNASSAGDGLTAPCDERGASGRENRSERPPGGGGVTSPSGGWTVIPRGGQRGGRRRPCSAARTVSRAPRCAPRRRRDATTTPAATTTTTAVRFRLPYRHRGSGARSDDVRGRCLYARRSVAAGTVLNVAVRRAGHRLHDNNNDDTIITQRDDVCVVYGAISVTDLRLCFPPTIFFFFFIRSAE